MHITAFEYQKKFHSLLELGNCPTREEALNKSGTLLYTTKKCLVYQTGSITHTRVLVNDSRNVHIEAPSQIVNYIGLCGGEAASFLGILNHGDCVAVDIASRLVFNEKTLVRAYIGFYQESMDTLEPDSKVSERNDYEGYNEGKFYLKTRSYGTIEIIFVHFRFANAKEREMAASIKLHDSELMSNYMKQIKKIATPNKTTVISLSTSKFDTYYTQHFIKAEYSRAIRDVEIDEMNMRLRFEEINRGILVPHLHYEFYPFLESDKAGYRHANPLTWEGTSMLEIQILHAINKARKNVNLCDKNEDRQCVRARELLETLMAFHKEFHYGRANWVKLSVEDKNAFSSRYSNRVKSFLSLIETLTKDIRQIRRNAKLAQQNLTRHTSNEISKTPKKSRKGHPIRHNRKRTASPRKRQ